MFENLDVFRMSAALASYAGQRQALIAQNVANADTPGYQARDLPEFKFAYTPTETDMSQKATRGGHLNGAQPGTLSVAPTEVEEQASPNGNKVALETEMLKSADAKRSHDRALAIYKTTLGILRSTIRT